MLESLQRETTSEEVRTKFGVSTSMIHRWRQEFQAKAASIFVTTLKIMSVFLFTLYSKGL